VTRANRRGRWHARGRRDIAIDLGTANTVVYVRGRGIVLSEPSVVAIDEPSGEVQAVGVEAQQMIGRTPARISAIRPLRHGVIADFDVTEQMLRHFLAAAGASRRARARLVLCAPSGITQVEHRALEEAAEAAGARHTQLIEEPLAAAIGAGLAIADPIGHMVVDIGGGTSEVAVLSLGAIVTSRSARVGGYDLDDAVTAHLRERHRMAVGSQAAEQIKLAIGSAMELPEELETAIRGRDLLTGLPRELTLTATELRPALQPALNEILTNIHATLEDTPPELAGDITRYGILLAGGGSLLHGLLERVHAETGMPVTMAEDPLGCVALGAGHALEELDSLRM